MSFIKSSTSFTRFRIQDPVPAGFWPTVLDKLRQYSMKDIDDVPEERGFGWVSYEDMLDTTWRFAPVEKGTYLAFCLRLDTRRVPPAVLKKHLAVVVKQEEAQMREQGKKFVSRERKKELKEQVNLRLRMRFLPIPALFEVVWNTATGHVYFASTQQKMIEMFDELFTRTFDLHLEALGPYELALVHIKNPAPLDTLQPTRFA